MRSDGATRFVADTHVLYWYLLRSRELSAASRTALRLVEAGLAELWIPAIAVAELDYLCRKYRVPGLAGPLLEQAQASGNYRIVPLGTETLRIFLGLEAPPEMHDRLIAAEALRLGAPVITRDRALREAGVVETIW